MLKRKIKNLKSGFLLIELIVALFIFSLVSTVSIGSIITIFDANKKAQSLQSVMNNLNLAMDSMTKALAVGSDYQCLVLIGESLDPVVGDDCNNLDSVGSGVRFLSQDNEVVDYYIRKACDENADLTVGCLVRRINSGPIDERIPVPLTATDIKLKKYEFIISGTDPLDNFQPKVSIFLSGEVDAGPRNKTNFSLQTAVSQRKPDSPSAQGRGTSPDFRWSFF